MDTIAYKNLGLIFPGQGAQYVGMGRPFFDQFAVAKRTFQEADDILKRSLSKIIFEGPAATLTETGNSQAGMFVVGVALMRVLQEIHPVKPLACAGLSLGEYTALTAAGWISFAEALPLVQMRGDFMNEACKVSPGSMIVIVGMENKAVEELVKKLNLPNALWIANLNCPGQAVLSGTNEAIKKATEEFSKVAKMVIPLQVQGAFHSGLMLPAAEKLTPHIEKCTFTKGGRIAMNVPGDFVSEPEQVKKYLCEQVTHSVKWESDVRAMCREGVDLFIEFGPGKTLSGLNKRMGLTAQTISIESVADLEQLKRLKQG